MQHHLHPDFEDRQRDQSVFSVLERRSATYILIVEDRGRDWAVFSVLEWSDVA
jgi:hypothetical protein